MPIELPGRNSRMMEPKQVCPLQIRTASSVYIFVLSLPTGRPGDEALYSDAVLRLSA